MINAIIIITQWKLCSVLNYILSVQTDEEGPQERLSQLQADCEAVGSFKEGPKKSI